MFVCMHTPLNWYWVSTCTCNINVCSRINRCLFSIVSHWHMHTKPFVFTACSVYSTYIRYKLAAEEDLRGQNALLSISHYENCSIYLPDKAWACSKPIHSNQTTLVIRTYQNICTYIKIYRYKDVSKYQHIKKHAKTWDCTAISCAYT